MADSKAALRTLWCATLNELLDRFRNPPEGGLTASWLRVAVAFLQDNHINAQTLADQRAGLERLAELARSFEGMDET